MTQNLKLNDQLSDGSPLDLRDAIESAEAKQSTLYPTTHEKAKLMEAIHRSNFLACSAPQIVEHIFQKGSW